LLVSFGSFRLSVGGAATVTDTGGIAAGGVGVGPGGAGGGGVGDEVPIGLTCVGTLGEDGVEVVDERVGRAGMARSAGRATRLWPCGTSRLRGETVTEAGLVSPFSGGTPGEGPSACGTVVRRSVDTHTEAPTVANAGARGPIRSTTLITSALAAPPIGLRTPTSFSSAESDADLNATRVVASQRRLSPLSTSRRLRRRPEACRESRRSRRSRVSRSALRTVPGSRPRGHTRPPRPCRAPRR